MLDYLHGTVSKQTLPPAAFANTASNFDAVAMRTRFAF